MVDIGVDPSGDVYIVGDFWGVVDFDPGTGSDIHTADGMDEKGYIHKMTSDWEHLWVNVWEIGYGDTRGIDASIPGVIFVCGNFDGTTDFNPGSGTDIHSSYGSDQDAVLMKCLSNGSW